MINLQKSLVTQCGKKYLLKFEEKKYAVLWRKIQSNRFHYCPSQKAIIRNTQILFFYTFAKILEMGPLGFAALVDFG